MSSPLFFAEEIGGIEVLRCGPLHRGGVRHGFTTRSGGFGRRGEEGDAQRLSSALGLARHATMRQVHGAEVLEAERGGAPACDGLVTDRAGLALMVQSADCVPLLFWAPDRGAVAAVHAGWRGTAARIASRAVRKLEGALGAAPGELHAALGPAIRACCYEVGDEVIARFSDVGSVSRPGPRGRRHLDLIELNRRELLEAGVLEGRIYDSGLCTYCANDRFYSYRREGAGAGRIFGAIGLA